MRTRCRLFAVTLALAIATLDARAAALEMRVSEVRARESRVRVTFELRDVLRDRFLELVQQGRSIFLQLQAELWQDRRMADRLTLTTPALTYRITRDGDRNVVISQYGDRSTLTDLRAPVTLEAELGPASVLVDSASYYLQAQVTTATVVDQEIDRLSTSIFGDRESAAGLAGLGRFVFGTVLRVGRYLESVSARVTSGKYTGLQIRSGAR